MDAKIDKLVETTKVETEKNEKALDGVKSIIECQNKNETMIRSRFEDHLVKIDKLVETTKVETEKNESCGWC